MWKRSVHIANNRTPLGVRRCAQWLFSDSALIGALRDPCIKSKKKKKLNVSSRPFNAGVRRRAEKSVCDKLAEPSSIKICNNVIVTDRTGRHCCVSLWCESRTSTRKHVQKYTHKQTHTHTTHYPVYTSVYCRKYARTCIYRRPGDVNACVRALSFAGSWKEDGRLPKTQEQK